jgi:hypothetical protein
MVAATILCKVMAANFTPVPGHESLLYHRSKVEPENNLHICPFCSAVQNETIMTYHQTQVIEHSAVDSSDMILMYL